MRLGRQERSRSSKVSRNSFVVPYTTGLPGTSFLPTILMNLFSMSVASTPPESTPLMPSISPLVTGCLYAMTASVSMAALLIFCMPILKNLLSHGANSGFVLNW